MKRLLGVLIFSFLINLCYSQDKTITYVYNKTSNAIERVYTDGTKVVEKTYQVAQAVVPKLERALQSLGNTLKVGASEVWDILVKQQLVWALCILLCLLATLFSWWHFYYRVAEWRKNDHQEAYISVCVITFIIAGAGTIVTAMNFQDMMTGFINPRFGALKTVVEIAQQIK